MENEFKPVDFIDQIKEFIRHVVFKLQDSKDIPLIYDKKNSGYTSSGSEGGNKKKKHQDVDWAFDCKDSSYFEKYMEGEGP